MKKLITTITCVALGCLAMQAQEFEEYRIMRVKTLDGNEPIEIEVSNVGEIEFETLTREIPQEPEPTEIYYEYVDLGLPSGLLWATCNLGATNPEDYGDFYAWGETETKETYTWDNYKYGTIGALTKYYWAEGAKDVDKFVLDPDDDAVVVNWGYGWRTPTHEELKELENNCDWEYTTINGINGYKVMNKEDAEKWIFLPEAGYRSGTTSAHTNIWGYYWSATLNPYNGAKAANSYKFRDAEHSWVCNYERYRGQTIRAVHDPIK